MADRIRILRDEVERLNETISRLEAGAAESVDELTVRSVRVVGEDGSLHVLLTADADGLGAAGIVIYGPDGAPGASLTHRAAMADGHPDAEAALTLGAALALRYRDSDGVRSAGLEISDPGPAGEATRRLYCGTEAGVAHVTLHDALGRPRLRLRVERNGSATADELDENGGVVRRL